MLWNANELAKISGDFERKIIYFLFMTKDSLSREAMMPPRSLTPPVGQITDIVYDLAKIFTIFFYSLFI